MSNANEVAAGSRASGGPMPNANEDAASKSGPMANANNLTRLHAPLTPMSNANAGPQRLEILNYIESNNDPHWHCAQP